MRRRYVPDLTALMAECEANYLRLNKLLPTLEENDEREFVLEQAGEEIQVVIRVQERFSHTLTLEFWIGQALHPELPATCLTIRLYQDVRMAEVVDARGGRQIKGVHYYPNEWMQQPDEKHQLNAYLGQWLRHCLERGYESPYSLQGSMAFSGGR